MTRHQCHKLRRHRRYKYLYYGTLRINTRPHGEVPVSRRRRSREQNQSSEGTPRFVCHRSTGFRDLISTEAQTRLRNRSRAQRRTRRPPPAPHSPRTTPTHPPSRPPDRPSHIRQRPARVRWRMGGKRRTDVPVLLHILSRVIVATTLSVSLILIVASIVVQLPVTSSSRGSGCALPEAVLTKWTVCKQWRTTMTG